MADNDGLVVYQLRIRILDISPMIWRRLLVRSDSTIADLHYCLQIAFGWSNFYLHCFKIHGQEHGVGRMYGNHFAIDGNMVPLSQFQFGVNERFLYEYNFFHWWQLEIRVEKILPFDLEGIYPICTGGARQGPPEDCGGPWAYLTLRDHYSVGHFIDCLQTYTDGGFDEYQEADLLHELRQFQYWLRADQLSRRQLNRLLKWYGHGDKRWKEESELEVVP